jgi:hypothetical protein
MIPQTRPFLIVPCRTFEDALRVAYRSSKVPLLAKCPGNRRSHIKTENAGHALPKGASEQSGSTDQQDGTSSRERRPNKQDTGAWLSPFDSTGGIPLFLSDRPLAYRVMPAHR